MKKNSEEKIVEENLSKGKKTFKIIKRIFSVFITIILISFVLVVCLQRFSNNKISFFKYRMFSVVSGSMYPKYKIGDILISKEVLPETIKRGDDISYLVVNKNSQIYGQVITHQVTKSWIDDQGKYMFRAKGIYSLAEDNDDISEDQLYGKIIYKTFILSFIYKIVSTNVGFYLFIIVPILFIIGSEVISTLLNKEDQRRKKI